MVLEAGTPAGGPVLQLALLVQKVRQVGLLIAELLANFGKVAAKVFKHVGVRAQFKTVHRRIAGNAPWALVIVNDQELARLGKKVIQASGDDHVHVQEQGGASQAVKVCAEGDEFGPATFWNAGGQIQGRNGLAFHFAANAAGIIGQAYKPEVAAQVAAYHGVQPVDVFGAVLLAPLHADDVALVTRLSVSWHGVSRLDAF